jgi:multiple RNA-binding domain-containing protein 1
LLDDHALKLSLSTKKVTEAETEKSKSKVLKKRTAKEVAKASSGELAIIESDVALSNKLMVKNLAFEATQEDIKELFKSYGALRKVRLPKKVNSTNHRGFGFVEFVSPQEAKLAFKALQNTHLYNRKVVIEWAKAETLLTATDNTEKTEVEEPEKKRKKA